jgi:hypothetical protein
MTMLRMLALAFPLLLVPCASQAKTVDGSSAIALAALVGINSPLLDEGENAALAKLLNGEADTGFPAGKTIAVRADKVACRASNVDIKAHSCALTFGKHEVTLSGRAAHELYATLFEIGVPPDAGAGSVFERMSPLDCMIEPSAVAENAGGGAHCQYAAPE